jgi:predicted nucleotidyltransferase
MARRNFREHLLGDEIRYKKYLYVLRPLLAAHWIRDGRGAAPMVFADLVRETLDDAPLVDEIDRLLQVKMSAGEGAKSKRWERIHAFIESELALAETHAFPPQPALPQDGLDDFLRETVLRA